MNNIEELKKAALGANLHGWTGFEDALNADGYSEAVSKFIGHCSPSAILALIAQLEAAQLELIKPLPIGELVHRLEGQTYEKWFSESDVKDLRDRAEKAESELSAANEKLSKPVVLPQRYECEGYHIGEAYLDPNPEGDCFDRDEVIEAIKAAGFTVEGE
ncbi:hypothetical protein [Yersinia intermedia]|uniref:hypothetical protein n=1 Tax=Yersinia intermedia TaxID=631 RepID=UPI0030CEA89B